MLTVLEKSLRLSYFNRIDRGNRFLIKNIMKVDLGKSVFYFFLVIFLPGLVYGQGEEILSRFTASESAGRVDVVWTMRAGNLCLGIDVERTTDTVNGSIETVHRIAGECGDERVDVTYRFADFDADEGVVNYYRLILGAVPTTFRAVEIPNYGDRGMSISPNPAAQKVTVRYKNPDREVFGMRLFTFSGELLQSIEGLRGDSLELYIDKLKAGTYLLKMASKTKNYSSKLVVLP